LLRICAHDQTREPAADTADDQPNDNSDHELFPPVQVTAATIAAIKPASQTRDARRLFRIRKGLARNLVNAPASKRQQSWINAAQ
jgi:hypothetical protein